MNLSRTLAATATAISVLAAIGCSSSQRAPEVAAAPMAVPAAPPEPMVAVDAMPSHPALPSERPVEVAVAPAAPAAPAIVPAEAAPVVVTQQPVMSTAPADFTERAPQADRN